jgi:hypothetical protein
MRFQVSVLDFLSLDRDQWWVNNSLRPKFSLCIPKLKICNCTLRPRTVLYVFCTNVRANSDYFPIQH